MNNQARENRVRYLDDPELFKPVEKVVNGETMLFTPTYYQRVYENETGGWTTEYSLNPFENEQKEESNPR